LWCHSPHCYVIARSAKHDVAIHQHEVFLLKALNFFVVTD
jgi:hypothetical protein